MGNYSCIIFQCNNNLFNLSALSLLFQKPSSCAIEIENVVSFICCRILINPGAASSPQFFFLSCYFFVIIFFEYKVLVENRISDFFGETLLEIMHPLVLSTNYWFSHCYLYFSPG